MCQLHLAMRSWKLILQLNRKQPNRAKHGTRCAIGFLLSSFYNSMCISNHEVVDNILHFLAAPHRCIHSKSEFRGSNRAAKNLNFPQICPKMPRNGPKMAQNGPKRPNMTQEWPKWSKMAQEWPKMTQNGPKMAQNGPIWPKMTQNETKMAQIGRIWPKMTQNDPKWPKMTQNDPKWP